MEDENDVLDWDEDEEQTHGGNGGPVDDADGVSLGSDSGDENESAVAPSAAGAARRSPGVQDINGTSRPVSPKSTSLSAPPMEREDSSSSLNARKRKDSPPRTSPRPHNRQSRSRSNKSITSSKLIHGLPPKPVGLNVPFLPPSHPSLTEATAMSTRESGKGKSGGTNNKNNPVAPKSVSSEGRESSLPPDWQIRHSRSEANSVYYYNIRTHESTWTRPSPHTSSRSGQHSARDASLDTKYADNSSLSYEDRHYRPGGAPSALDDIPAHASKRDSWHGSPDYVHQHGPDEYPAPGSPQSRRNRSLSPGSPRGRDSGRRNRVSHQPPGRGPRHADRDRDRDRDVIYPRDADYDRHWDSPTDLGHSKSRRQNARQPHDSQSYPDAAGPSPHEPYLEREEQTGRQSSYGKRGAHDRDEGRDQEPRDQNLFHRHRSPPPHMHAQEFTERVPASAASGKRERPSRFAPAPASVPVGEEEDAWVPDEFKPDGNRQQVKEQRPEQLPDADISRANKADQPSSPQHVAGAPDASDAKSAPRRRKRQPLPPQSMRFREVSKSNKDSATPIPGVIVEAAPATSSVVQEPQIQSMPPPPRSLPAPAASRSHSASTMARDSPPHQRVSKFGPPKADVDLPAGPRYPDHSHNGRPGEEGGSDDRERRDGRRPPGAPGYYSSSSGPPEFADSMPSPRSSRYRRSPSADSSARAGAGVHVDREMMSFSDRERETVEDPVPRGPRAMGSQSLISTSSVNMYPNRTRERSPPSFESDEQSGTPRSDFEPVRSGREPTFGGHGPRRRPPHPGKGPAVSRQPAPHLSGTNNIPVGNRHSADNLPSGPSKTSSNHYSLPPPMPPPGISGANTVPLKNSRYPANSNPDVPPSSRLPSPPPRASGSMDTFRNTAELGTSHLLPPRPVPLYDTMKSNPRVATPPPSSRESSTASPNWEHPGSERGRVRSSNPRGNPTMDRYIPNENSAPSVGRSRSAEGGLHERLDRPRTGNGHVPHGLPMNPSLRMPPRSTAPDVGRLEQPDARPRDEGRNNPARMSNDRPVVPVDSRRDADRRLPDAHPLPVRPDVTPARSSSSKNRRSSVSQALGTEPLPMRMDVDRRDQGVDSDEHRQRPAPTRRGGSLLDRMSLDARGDEGMSGTPLRDRVQIPSKRDRDDLLRSDDRFGMDVDGDDGAVGDSNPKRRRRSGKPRRSRRGGSYN